MMDDEMASDEHIEGRSGERARDASADAAPAPLRALDDVVAPDRLRLAVAEAVAGARRAGTRRPPFAGLRLGPALAASGALAAVLLALLVFGGGGGSAAPGVRDVAQVALRPVADPPPAALPGGELLRAHAGPIAFPTWTHAGLRAVGARSDTIGGHELRTVFYSDRAGRRIGYAIADARLPVAGGRIVVRRGARLRVLDGGATAVVTWRRDGRTCVLAGRGVPVGRLLTLASYAA